MPINVVLVEPEIPPNTGNIIRLCANTGARLHLVEPMGFPLDHSRMRRAGLDYHEFASLTVHTSWAAFNALVESIESDVGSTAGTAVCAPVGTRYAITTKGSRNAFELQYTANDWLIFGPETRGLSAEILAGFDNNTRVRIPMRPDNRSLNLSNAVAVLVYEAWRQQGFRGGN